MPTVSIIMPVYNTGEILRTTIESVLAQTFKDFELLLIDDGSKDISAKICDEYAVKDSRIRIFHKKNGGICDARNFGLSYAKGNYITFCDHDDEYLKNYLECLINTAILNNADLVRCNYITQYDNGKQIKSEFESLYLSEKEITNNFIHLYQNNYFNTVWCVLYKKETINGILFDTKFKYGGEDFNFNMRLITKLHKVITITDILYIHYFRQTLSTSAKFHKDNIKIGYYSFLLFSDIVQQYNLAEKYQNEYFSTFYTDVLSILGATSRSNASYSEIVSTINLMKKRTKEVSTEPNIIPLSAFKRHQVFIFYCFSKLHLTYLFFSLLKIKHQTY